MSFLLYCYYYYIIDWEYNRECYTIRGEIGKVHIRDS